MAENDLNAVAFPKLNEAQMAALRRCPLTKLKRLQDGVKLFEVGEPDINFLVVKSGAVEIVVSNVTQSESQHTKLLRRAARSSIFAIRGTGPKP